MRKAARVILVGDAQTLDRARLLSTYLIFERPEMDTFPRVCRRAAEGENGARCGRSRQRSACSEEGEPTGGPCPCSFAAHWGPSHAELSGRSLTLPDRDGTNLPAELPSFQHAIENEKDDGAKHRDHYTAKVEARNGSVSDP